MLQALNRQTNKQGSNLLPHLGLSRYEKFVQLQQVRHSQKRRQHTPNDCSYFQPLGRVQIWATAPLQRHPPSEQSAAPHSKHVSSVTFEEVHGVSWGIIINNIVKRKEVFSHNPLIINKGTMYWKMRSYCDPGSLSTLLDSQRYWKVHEVVTQNSCATAVVQVHKQD